MAAAKKPAAKAEVSNRKNGKAPKAKPQTNEQFASGHTHQGYSAAAVQRRAMKRLASK